VKSPLSKKRPFGAGSALQKHMARNTATKSLRDCTVLQNCLRVAGKRPLRRAKSVRRACNFFLDGLKKGNVHDTSGAKN
jgi:hypothetical protein